jgi:hypothetical protein
VIYEIVNDDGTIARVPDLVQFCKMHDFMMISVADLVWYLLAWDNEGSLGATAGLFPVCIRNFATELGLVPGGAARSGQEP